MNSTHELRNKQLHPIQLKKVIFCLNDTFISGMYDASNYVKLFTASSDKFMIRFCEFSTFNFVSGVHHLFLTTF